MDHYCDLNGFICFPNFDESYHYLLEMLLESGHSDAGQGCHQIFTIAYKVIEPFVRRELIERLGIPYSWLIDELEERLSQKPINPGTAWEKRVNIYKSKLHDGKFNYTVAERIYSQLDYIVTLLKSNPNSRRAILCIWQSSKDSYTEREVPSTISGQFFIRGDYLDALYISRSSDCIKFLPADFFFYLGVQTWVASQLGIKPGTLAHTVGALFIRDEDVKLAREILMSPP